MYIYIYIHVFIYLFICIPSLGVLASWVNKNKIQNPYFLSQNCQESLRRGLGTPNPVASADVAPDRNSAGRVSGFCGLSHQRLLQIFLTVQTGYILSFSKQPQCVITGYSSTRKECLVQRPKPKTLNPEPQISNLKP